MARPDIQQVLENLDRRTERIEQILPTLPTRDEMHEAIRTAVAPLPTKEELKAAIATAIAPLATKEELTTAIAPLATRAELREEGERTRRHFDVVAESLRDDIRAIADGHLAIQQRSEEQRAAADVMKADVGRLDTRVTRLEAGRARRRSEH